MRAQAVCCAGCLQPQPAFGIPLAALGFSAKTGQLVVSRPVARVVAMDVKSEKVRSPVLYLQLCLQLYLQLYLQLFSIYLEGRIDGLAACITRVTPRASVERTVLAAVGKCLLLCCCVIAVWQQEALLAAALNTSSPQRFRALSLQPLAS